MFVGEDCDIVRVWGVVDFQPRVLLCVSLAKGLFVGDIVAHIDVPRG